MSQIRDGWEAVESEETRLLRQMSATESLRQFLRLQVEFKDWLEETESLFRTERDEAMIELQARLAAMNQYWQSTMETLIDARL